ncbi:EB1 homolog, putative [Plasmodium vinckei brucechwatti]|uniref:EB1 homolog, putative n=1 Tax=Plasmodium vinckei brucechwatti TaxID=119398 RepID=A0A6V7RWU1_PLAVN|nr:EB1 homolog, putative [Plasmodium vinckei brucechwatti]
MHEGKGIFSFGNMDSGFVVSRKELIEWVNSFLKLNITKIEQCSNGAIYIQLLDILFPNKSVLHKAKWNAKMEYECIVNYKLIQSVFNKLGIKKDMDVDKLIKGKYQDNLEFLQWFKAFFERLVDYNNEQIANYDPMERRKICILGERGDYKLLNNYMPDWAKVDLNLIKDKIVSNNSKKNTDPIPNTYQNMNTTNLIPTSNSSANIQSNINTKNNQATNNIHSHNNHSRSLSRKDLKRNEKPNNLASTTIKYNTSHNSKDINFQKKKLSTIGIDTNKTNNRLSILNKLTSQNSMSSYYNKNSISENSKDNISLIDQNKKLKNLLENKNQEITLLQNKLQEEQYEKKVILFEKNFYYNKLRFLELLCHQTNNDSILINDIHQIIYARENTYFHQTISTQNQEDTNDDGNSNGITQNNNNCTEQYGMENAEQHAIGSHIE